MEGFIEVFRVGDSAETVAPDGAQRTLVDTAGARRAPTPLGSRSRQPPEETVPEPFKNLFNTNVISEMARHLSRASAEVGVPAFDGKSFRRRAGRNLEALELKERSAQIEEALTEFLPDDFPVAAEVLRGALRDHGQGSTEPAVAPREGLSGLALMPVADYVARHGLEYFDLALALLKELTKQSSSEFAIRPFLVAEQERTLTVLEEWTGDSNHHVRRLVSEGTRPRLPWGTRLSAFVEDPRPVLTLLEALKDDPSEYVRRSVANNLNDVAKDHPDLVVGIAARWLEGASEERRRLVRHACRTLVKQGHPGALKALGYGPPRISLGALTVLTPVVRLGEALSFEVAFRSDADSEQSLMVDYVIHHRKANGTTSPKVFKWKTLTLAAGNEHRAVRKHSMKRITTRTYYPGAHFVELQVNGRVMGKAEFEVEV
jgi:3-methyladenine DNA glycosylase AlkC